MPAKAGIQNHMKILDSRLRGNDANGDFKTFYETIKSIASIILVCEPTTYNRHQRINIASP